MNWPGSTECNRWVNFPGDQRCIGRFVDVVITEVIAEFPTWPAPGFGT